jgi:NADH:ubiquinone oxidoreductase subunit 6 (subunit J)
MRWNPLLNAGAAAAYIGAVALFMHFIGSLRHDTPDTLLDGMGVISLFVFSAAVMAFLFFYQPILMLIDNKKKEAVTYFLQTLAIFGAITIGVLISVSVQ